MLKSKRLTKYEFISAMVMLAVRDPLSYQALRAKAWELAVIAKLSFRTN